jgi:hypothetical protein
VFLNAGGRSNGVGMSFGLLKAYAKQALKEHLNIELE